MGRKDGPCPLEKPKVSSIEVPGVGKEREGPAEVAVVVGAGGTFLTVFLMARWEVRKVEVDTLGGLLVGAAEVEVA